MQEKHSREHGGRVCLDSQSALSGSLVGHLSCTLVYPNCSALSLNTEGGIGSLTPGGGPLCDVLEHLVQLLRAPGGQVCQEVVVQTAEKAAQRVALIADRESGLSEGPRHGEAARAQRPALSLVSRPSARQLPDPLLGLSLSGFCRALSALSRRSLGALSALSLGALQDLSRPSHNCSLQVPLLCVCLHIRQPQLLSWLAQINLKLF